MRNRPARGFTLVEVLIALAITAVVSVIAYSGLSTVLTAADTLRASAERTQQINRAWTIISRDLNEIAARPVRDEFGEVEPALTGGELARFPLSLTRGGWHNSAGYPRSHLQRVNYRVEEEVLWRDSYPVLDRVGDSEPQSVELLDQVESLELLFLGSLNDVRAEAGGSALDQRNWLENWVPDAGGDGGALALPVAVELRLRLRDWGELRRVYALPPL